MSSTQIAHQLGMTRPPFLVRPIAAACILLAMSASAAYAQAVQSEPVPAKTTTAEELPSAEKPSASDSKAKPAPADAAAPITTVVVMGLRRSLEDSLSVKRHSDSIVEVVSAEELGKLPDASIAEALSRLPGVVGQRGPDGRVNVISIRGLSPEFSGSLLNGREVVSSNDARTVEYDQFPSELIGSAVVYKTPDGTLIGQGLSGTVDLRTRRPLDTRGREVAVNVRGERNSNGTLVSDVASPTGSRVSISYVDQFANNTIGLAVGFARLDVSSQVKQTELVEYGDYSPFGLPLNGNADAKFPNASGNIGKSLLPMFWTATSSTKSNTRDGLMAVLEFKPNKDLHSTLDLYYSKFDTHEVGGKFLSSMFATWGGGVTPNLSDITTTQVGKNTLTTSATADKMPVTTGNFDTKREDSISALGWNTELKLNDQWTAVTDLSFSRDIRDETYSEVYAAPFDNATQNWTYGAFKWNVPVNGGAQTWTPLQSNYLANPAIVKLGDQAGFDFVGDQDAYTGAIRNPHIKDEIKSLRLSAKRTLDGPFSNLTFGANFTQRDKDVSKNESRLLMRKDSNGNYIRDIPAAALGQPMDMSWAGIPGLIRINVPALVSQGAVTQQVLFAQKVDNDSGVHEKVTTIFGKLDLDTELASIPLRGNLGLQVVNTKQNSTGWEYRGDNANPDPSLLFARSGGTTYTDLLPSLNLVAELKNNWIARVGVAKTLARPNIVDMRAGTSTPTVIIEPGPDQGKWRTAYAGNPELQPWRANSFDLSLEKYFGKRSYISVAAFSKKLLNYVYNEQTARDNSGFPVQAGVPANVIVQKFGPVIKPSNGEGGELRGFELSGALEGGMIHPWLDGFGVVATGSYLTSSIFDKEGKEIKLNGLSGTTGSATFYYEKHGFSARISERYRSAFTATTRDIFLNATTRQQKADQVLDLQLGYEFDTPSLKGLSLLLQVNNLNDKPTQNLVSAGQNAPDREALYPNYTYYFGRQVLLGANYKF
jgi:iron complex outermembrane receptor protein